MVTRSNFRAVVAVVITGTLCCPPAQALVSFNDGKEHIYVTGTVSMAYDSNIFAHAGGGSDYISSAGLLVEYTRRAGWIGVNGSVSVDISSFKDNPSENFTDPKFTAEFTKSSGRTTGALTLSAARESRADTAANLRDQSWVYNAALNFKYPVIDRYSVSGNFGYSDRIFDNSNLLSNIRTYTAGADLFYVFSSERDLLAGYQYRRSDTSSNSSFDDHSFTIGVVGRIISKLNGSLRAGYQIRTPRGSGSDGEFRGLTAAGAVTWTLTKKLSLTGQLSQDVTTTATDISVDTTGASVDLQYALRSNFSLFANVGAGKNRFLGQLGAGRHDEYFTWGAGLNYTLNEHLKLALSYLYYTNSSTLSYSDFSRNSFTLTASSRW